MCRNIQMQRRVVFRQATLIYNLVLIIYKKNLFIYNEDKKKIHDYIFGFGLCIKGGKPEKGGKIWHFFVNFIYKKNPDYI